jgi:hypothetical protein
LRTKSTFGAKHLCSVFYFHGKVVFTFAVIRVSQLRGARERIGTIEQKKTISLYVDNMWVWQQGRYWVAKAVAFSENGNDGTISACHDSPELAYQRLVAGMKELRLVPDDWDE